MFLLMSVLGALKAPCRRIGYTKGTLRAAERQAPERFYAFLDVRATYDSAS